MPAQSDILHRIPRFKDAWLPFYRLILENSHAPRWNAQCGDRLIEEDIAGLTEFAATLGGTQNGIWNAEQQDRWLRKFAILSPWIRSALEDSASSTMNRDDLRLRMHEIIPLNADLDRLVLNPTSGTTGMPVEVPNNPAGVATYQPLILEALARHGISRDIRGKMAAVQICSQRDTMTYGTLHSFYEGAGFAKINIPPGGEESILRHWRHTDDIQAFLESTVPAFLTGDPFAFRILMDYGIRYRPSAVLCTASTLSDALRDAMTEYFQCPVVDFYSSNETGPVACSCPQHPERFHFLSSDIHCEVVDEWGNPTDGEGTLLLTGGRNPMLPLYRYNTGDSVQVIRTDCSCGQQTYLQGLRGRPLVQFHGRKGKVNPLDFARLLRLVPMRRHRLLQRKDQSVDCYVDPGDFSLEAHSEFIIRSSGEILDGLEVRLHPWESGDAEFAAFSSPAFPYQSEIE